MARYLLLWNVDATRAPEDLEERRKLWLRMLETSKQQLADGTTSDWGAFVGETRGFVILEGSEVDAHALTSSWLPAASFEVTQLLSVEQVIEATKKM